MGSHGPGSPAGGSDIGGSDNEDEFDSEEEEDLVDRPRKKHKSSGFILEEAGRYQQFDAGFPQGLFAYHALLCYLAHLLDLRRLDIHITYNNTKLICIFILEFSYILMNYLRVHMEQNEVLVHLKKII